jgi:2-polyprenyl-3-methyl-5-hydroxy-6-metoxy-1,4-benzoquinol methylase
VPESPAKDAGPRTSAPETAKGETHAGDARPPTGFPYFRFSAEPGSTHRLVVGLVPEGSRVLEFGCATGYMSKVLKEERSCSVVGVEIDPEAAELAKEHCDRVVVADAETLDFEEAFEEERFDAILFADVLEHFRDPGAVLRRIRPFLAEEGRVVASLPNIAHASVRLALMQGEFRYRDTGLLDDTHLRFFTRAGVQDLFESSGFVITLWERRRQDIEDSEVRVSLPVPDVAREWLAADPDSTTYQFVVGAVPSHAGPQLAAVRAERDELRARVGLLEPLIREREAELQALRLKLEEANARETDYRETISGLNEELMRGIEEQEAERAELVRSSEARAKQQEAELQALRLKLEAANARETDYRETVFGLNEELMRGSEMLEAERAELDRVRSSEDEAKARLKWLEELVEERDASVAKLGLIATEYERLLQTKALRLIRTWWRFKAALLFWR